MLGDIKAFIFSLIECPANESFSCGSAACEKDCSNINETCDIVNIKCDDKCFCNEGFVRETPSGLCIPIEKCPMPTCEDPNAEHNKCGSSCSEATCKNPEGQSFDCPEMCETGCFCKKGYVKNEEGKCVLPETCPIPSKIFNFI